jgi:peptide/nickel transport system substrate-binding protein
MAVEGDKVRVQTYRSAGHRGFTSGVAWFRTRKKLAKRGFVAAAAILAVSSFVACSAGSVNTSAAGTEGAPGGKVVVRLYSGMATTDPFKDTSAPGWQLLRNVYEGLVALDDKLQPHPLIAESWKANSAATEYTFVLRQGVTFHNGKPVTPDDVKYSLDYFRQYAANKSSLNAVDNVTVVDDKTVKVHLSRPKASLVADLGNPVAIPIVPKGSADKDGLAKNPIGTGPYTIKSFEPQVRAVLEAYPGYKPVDEEPSGLAGRRVAKVKTVEMVYVADDRVAAAGLETGEFDIITRVPPQDVKRLNDLPDVDVAASPGSAWIAINLNASAGEVANLKIRQAIMYATDPSAMLQTSGFGQGRLTNSYTPPEVDWYTKDASGYWPYKYDPDRAKQLLSEAGYDGRPITVIAGAPPYQEQNAVILQQQAKAVGLDLKVDKIDHTTFIERTQSGNFEMYSAGGPFQTTPDLFYGQYYCGTAGKNRYGYCDKEYDTIYDQASAVTDKAKRNALFAKLEKKLKNDAIILPLYFNDVDFGVNKRVSGLNANAFEWLIMWNVSVNS